MHLTSRNLALSLMSALIYWQGNIEASTSHKHASQYWIPLAISGDTIEITDRALGLAFGDQSLTQADSFDQTKIWDFLSWNGIDSSYTNSWYDPNWEMVASYTMSLECTDDSFLLISTSHKLNILEIRVDCCNFSFIQSAILKLLKICFVFTAHASVTWGHWFSVILRYQNIT